MRWLVRSTRWPLASLLAVTSALTLAAFGVTLRGQFVYDDVWTIVHNKHLEYPLGRLMSAAWRGESRRMHIPDATRPGMVASTWIDRHLFGLHAAGYHAHSLALAAVASALAGLAVFAVLRRRVPALVTAALFAIAPLHTEVVASINYREDLLSAIGCFAALALLFWPRPRRAEGRRGLAVEAGWTLACAAAWLFALAAKESSVILVPLLAVAWLARGARGAWPREREPMLLGLLAVGLVWLSWRVGLRFGGDDVPIAEGLTILQRVLRAARYEVWAVAGEILPFAAAPEHTPLDNADVAWGAAALAIVGGNVVLWMRRRLRIPAFGLSWALLAPLVSSPLVGPFNEQADRYLYLGVVGGGVLWAWGLEQLARRAGEPVALGAFGLAAVACIGLSERDAAVWRDETTLWTEAVRVAPGAARAWTGLSRVKAQEGDDATALDLAQHAVDLDSTAAEARLQLAFCLMRSGMSVQAKRELDFIAAKTPDSTGLARGRACLGEPPAKARECLAAP